ncbi:IS3 family transposase [Acetobacterium wieringae]|uniref:IS3 family transposase n=1 Tax=Acetobacterium wieringae TaxID=52694 RepID=UPI0026EA9811|nr:IS3 family transposase [Acetobacterium wieringae]
MTEAIYFEVTVKTEATIKEKRQVSVSGMLKILGVSRSGYHAWLKRMPSAMQIRRENIKVKILDIYNDSKQNYGAPKITKKLQQGGEFTSERTVGKYMRELGIRAQWIKPWTITTKNSDFSNKLQNILDEQFNPERPNAVWCSDITYIWTTEGFVYLTSIMDLYSRKIIAWTLSDSMGVSFIIDTIDKAKARRNTEQPLIIHSDRGSQYVSNEYRKATASMQRSYSKKAFPWDNACIESFHSLIKREWLNRFKINNYKQAYRLIFEYIEAFYNTKRIHSHCDYISPDDFEKLYEKAGKGELQLVG